MKQTEKQSLRLTSPIPPSVNHYTGIRAIISKGKPMAMMYETAEAKKYKKTFGEYVKEQVKQQGWVMSDDKFQKYYVDTLFYFPRVDMDCNNYWKCLFDSITETKSVWFDDNQACERVIAVFYDNKNPRLEIVIHPVSYIGVFKNTSQLEEFESNCIACTRYKRNCSLLKRAKEGRVQDEITVTNNEVKCSKFKKSNAKN